MVKESKKLVGRVRSKKLFFARTSVLGILVIGLAIGGLIVLSRYLLITWAMSPSVYLIEPSMLIPGMAK